MCGDATSLDDVTKLMAGEQADMIWTDPPYNVSYEGKTEDALTIQNDTFKDSAAFYDFLYLAFSNLSAITKPGSSIYICHADSEGLNFRKAMQDAGFLCKQCIIWNKNTMVLGRQDYQWKHEPILYGWKDGGTHYFIEDRDLTTVWDFDKPSRSEEHPTMKPLELVKYAIGNSSKRGQLIVDTFGGSGSTLISCDLMERTCYTMELDPKYCDVIRKRYAKHIGQEDWIQATPAVHKVEE
jgi:DNA modification methylase